MTARETKTTLRGLHTFTVAGYKSARAKYFEVYRKVMTLTCSGIQQSVRDRMCNELTCHPCGMTMHGCSIQWSWKVPTPACIYTLQFCMVPISTVVVAQLSMGYTATLY